MKDICIVGYNYGVRYMPFIPIYIYSILRSYPEYSVIVFSDTKLDSVTQKNIDLLKGMGDFEVVEDYNFGLSESQKITNLPGAKKAMRWLFYDERFSKYKSIYIGDIDMFMCREEIGIYEQHLAHSEKIGLPYSNYIRITSRIEKPSIKFILKNLSGLNLNTLATLSKKRLVYMKRLTGLHFVKTQEYYSVVSKHFDEFIKKLTDRNLDQRYIKSDEVLLYDLVNDSGLGLPPISPDSPSLDYNNYNSISFRPHHGLHMGIFRSDIGVIKQQQVLKSYIYKNYFSQYQYYKENDAIFNTIISNSPDYIKNQFQRMEKFYDASHTEGSN